MRFSRRHYRGVAELGRTQRMKLLVVISLSAGFLCWSGCSRTQQSTSCAVVAAASGERLSVESAARLAAKLANDECERLYKKRPFAPETYQVRFADGHYHWGHIDPAGIGGYSAEVAFRADGTQPEVRIWFSSDAVRIPPAR
jgi:hypothetical protein